MQEEESVGAARWLEAPSLTNPVCKHQIYAQQSKSWAEPPEALYRPRENPWLTSRGVCERVTFTVHTSEGGEQWADDATRRGPRGSRAACG